MLIGKKDRLEILEDALCYIVVFAMLAYGIGKLIQFDNTQISGQRVSELSGMELMWAFYGYSKPFAITLGLLEITGGILMFIKRTRILGCLLVTTILVNVILQDIFYDVNRGALKAAIIYQSLIIVILVLHKDKLIESFKVLTQLRNIHNTRKQVVIKVLLSGMLFIIFRMLEYYICSR